MSSLTHAMGDSSTMLRRVLRHTTRDPSMLIMSILLPGVLLLLLNYGFGGAIHPTTTASYLDYLVPGIILMAASYSVSATAVVVATESSEGIIDRFRTMAITRSAVLTGHVMGSILRTMAGTSLVVLIAVAIGFRPTTDPLHWLAVIGLVALLLFAVAWIATAMGLATGTASGAASLAAIFQILPFLSGAFVPTGTMPGWLQAFTANQPMTPIVSSLRGLLTDTPVGGSGWIAVVWCAGAAIVGFLWARRAYDRRTTG
jgi:ABC-2 type transport system permease protein